jgi:putative pyruvate formate lyase activating enzyme
MMSQLTDRFRVLSKDFQPAYLRLCDSGELKERVDRALALLESCTACPRNCRVNRLSDEKRVCHTGRWAVVSSYFPHFGEEDCLRGWRGSGTIFFSHCNLRCVFCQNYDISQGGEGCEVQAEELAGMMMRLQEMGCHNINFVTPEHVVPQIIEAVALAVERGLRVPLVYNTSAYDALESLRLMDGIIDIYMPDFKFWDAEMAFRYVKAKDYPEVARQAITEMHRQVGDLVFDEHGLAKRGVMIRHLIMPGGLAGTREIMRFIAGEISPNTYVNLMAQYHPAGKVSSQSYTEINRRITRQEYEDALRLADEEGLRRLDPRAVDLYRWS